ncbi:MAG: hypothetical protein AAF560_05950 [Acidobacteriota bacterium]
MFVKKHAVSFSVATLLMMSFAGAALATGGSQAPSIVGSWQATTTLEPAGEESLALFTFNGDNTFVATGPDASFSVAHGAWKQIGPRKYRLGNIGFVYDASGGIAFRIENRTILKVSANGNRFIAEFESDLTLPDGTVIQTTTGSSEGRRIKPNL